MAEKLNIAFKLKGGLGDILIDLNYINHIVTTINLQLVSIDIYAHRNLALVNALLPKENFINKVYLDQDINDDTTKYDLFCIINRYPDIRYRDYNKIHKIAPELIDFVFSCQKFRLENLRFFNYLPVCDAESNYLSIIQGKKRIQQPDIYNLYQLSEKFSYEISIDDKALNNFSNLNLIEKKFITIQRGTDDRQVLNSIKLWPFGFYNTLIKYIKDNFPSIPIVQLGINSDRCPELDGIDLNLVGKTSVEDLKVLLKNSFLHIDNEGGMVHLRHALNGGTSAVIFGPTSPEFYGYSENLNLRGQGCPHPCEWVVNKWQDHCAKGYGTQNTPCMLSLTPEYVFSKIKPLLGNI